MSPSTCTQVPESLTTCLLSQDCPLTLGLAVVMAMMMAVMLVLSVTDICPRRSTPFWRGGATPHTITFSLLHLVLIRMLLSPFFLQLVFLFVNRMCTERERECWYDSVDTQRCWQLIWRQDNVATDGEDEEEKKMGGESSSITTTTTVRVVLSAHCYHRLYLSGCISPPLANPLTNECFSY